MRKLLAVSIVLACAVHGPARSQESFPSRPIKWVVGTPAGGGTDIVARLVGTQMQKQMAQPLVVDNKPGAGTTIAADYVAKSTPDGYTILAADPGTIMFSTALYAKLPYDPVRDFAPVGLLARVPLLLAVHPGSGYEDVRQLVADMRATPEKFPVATSGIGGPHHVALEFLKDQAQLKLAHVPYKGGAAALQDVMAGVVPVMIADLTSAIGHIKGGKLKVLATFNAQPLTDLPGVPSLVQLNLTTRVPPSYLSVVAPAKTPPEVIDKLSSELQLALSDRDVQARLRDMGAEPLPTTSAQMKQQWTQDMAIWPALIRSKGITLD
ncbi:Bug family tripartite tricarboxylate transporter substrate binding protein [Variovorax paradoxus]|nr:tripartite tricarboxylate transporter substrate binding protein [Variovorax paradoxus]